ncbi:protein SHORTAGE IN CHIASMATA 1 [Citrus clementina]|uniref:protein SHORTAGE IN CHIASMATA 1 n=1 Tax=Citrus clementina TaxID=85681 RepID=UPI000CECF427|nr:protein SHORTAGE IN CHIASMATA 1 [Citrus x clementina]
MRTRFLNTDYFTTSSSSTPIETLNFLSLPIPHVSQSLLSVGKDDHLRFDSVLDVSLDIDQLPIHSALSKFFFDVIPQAIDVDFHDFEDLRFPISIVGGDEKESDIIDEEKEEESKRTSRLEALEVEPPKKDNETAMDDQNTHNFEVIQFETPEPAMFLENGSLYEKEEIWIVSEVPEIDNNLDMLTPGLAIQYLNEVRESVYSFDVVAFDYHVEQEASNLEDDGSFPDQMLCQSYMFPLLEVDEISRGTLEIPSTEDELLSILKKQELQHWTQKDNMLISSKEILGSLEYDILDVLLDHSSSKQCLESEMASQDMFHEMDFIGMVETSQLQENSKFHQLMEDSDCLLSMSPVIFEEFEISNVDLSKLFEVFFSTQAPSEPVACAWMFREDMNFKNFNELIIIQELALIDDTFKSLPTPVFSEKIRSVYAVVEEKLADLKPQPLSASDGIYLDWHLLDGDECSHKFFCYDQKILQEIDLHNIDFDLESSDDDKLVSTFIFSDNALSGPNMEGCEESLNTDFLGISGLYGHVMGVSSGKLFENGSPKPGNAEQSSERNAERVSLFFKSTSQFNDLDFFLNPQKPITGENCEFAVKEFDALSPSSNSMGAGLSSDVFQQWDVTLYKVKLSDDILALIDIFKKSYLAIVHNETELSSFVTSDDFKLLSLPKQRLMDCINRKRFQKANSHGDGNSMALITLCSIKLMAWYTCFYGIHTARLCVDKLCKSQGCLKSRLGSLQSLVVAADGKIDKETSSHPSLLVIQGILQSNSSQSNLKVLIVAEQSFWWSLKCLVMSMGLSCSELQNFYTHVDQPDVTKVYGSASAKMTDLPISDCLMVSHESVSASFPFNKFSLILEYGGSHGSSRISALSPKVAGLPHLHFLKVELDDSSASRALCEGLDVPENMEVLQELLDLLPVEDGYHMGSGEAADTIEACCMPPSVPCSQLAIESEQIQPRMMSYPVTVIVVNTQNVDKEMIVSRRSTYQKILALEKEGVQVVERDSDLPVDIIISTATCLVWYDYRNIGKKATALDEASSCLPLCVENIATNVLTLLSFTFSVCIMVFEGDTNFICTVMESSDGLYAAAASLGLDLQLFCSNSSELTDEIIVSCIGNSIKLTSGLYPKMPESETLAESFLTKFPSVNPLTAHAMLSSKGMLLELLECRHEQRIIAVKKYHVPEESTNLFSILCQSGEHEDSKSIMTDCSSSVSSGLDSDKSHLNSDSGRTQQKSIYNPDKIDILMNDFLQFEPLNQVTDGLLNPSKVFKLYDSWKDHEIFDDYQKPGSSVNELSGKKQELDFDMMMKASRVSKAYNSQIFECPRILEEINDPKFSLKDSLLGQNQGLGSAGMNNFDCHNISKTSCLQEDFIGEVVDLTSSPLSGKEFFSVPKSSSLSASVPQMENNSLMKSKIARRLSFGKNGLLHFPTAAELNSGSDIVDSGKVQRQSTQGTTDHPDTENNNDKLLLEHRKNLLDQVFVQRFAGSRGVPFQEEISHYNGTPLSKAIRSANPQPGSPWTVEFLNRIKEKSRLRQQSLPADTAAPCLGISGNLSKVTKRRSPSILEFFKYQGGSTPGKLPEKKKQKRSVNSSTLSENKMPSTSFLPTWTPVDKRSRQTLSFALNESGNQTKLVWNDGNSQSMRKKLRNQ